MYTIKKNKIVAVEATNSEGAVVLKLAQLPGTGVVVLYYCSYYY